MKGRKQTIFFKNRPYIIGTYSIGGVKEDEGPMHEWFDQCLADDTYGEKTWEKAESKMLKTAIVKAMERSGKSSDDTVSYTHLDVYKRQIPNRSWRSRRRSHLICDHC